LGLDDTQLPCPELGGPWVLKYEEDYVTRCEWGISQAFRFGNEQTDPVYEQLVPFFREQTVPFQHGLRTTSEFNFSFELPEVVPTQFKAVGSNDFPPQVVRCGCRASGDRQIVYVIRDSSKDSLPPDESVAMVTGQ
jgi:hypothetical protein